MHACTTRATSRGDCPTAISSTSAARTCRSSCAASASSWARSKRCCVGSRACATRSSPCARIRSRGRASSPTSSRKRAQPSMRTRCARSEGRRAGGATAAVERVLGVGRQPSTPQQYALWLELRLRADADAYNEPIALRVEARLGPERVRRALERLAARHELLRARLVEQEGEPCFVFDRAPAAVELEAPDTTALDLQAALRRPFDL